MPPYIYWHYEQVECENKQSTLATFVTYLLHPMFQFTRAEIVQLWNILGLFWLTFLVVRPFWFWHWEGSNYPFRSCNGPNGPKGSKFNKTKPTLVWWGVGVARSRDKEPGNGVGVGVDQATLTPTPARLSQSGRFGLCQNNISVKFSGISPFSNYSSQHWRKRERCGLKLFR